MRKFAVLFVLALILISAASAEASLYLSASGKTFNINVVRRDYRPIYEARGNVFVSGNTARIEISAPGYRSAHRSIYLQNNVNSYHETVTLDDPTIFVNLQADDYSNIADSTTSYFSQSLYQSDEFGIRGRFPVAGFEKITSRDLDVRVNSMFAWLPRVYLNQRGNYWDFEIVIKRRDFSDFSNRIQILVTRTPPEAPASLEYALAQAVDYNNNIMMLEKNRDELLLARLESLAREIRQAYIALPLEAREQLLSTIEADVLKGELQDISSFELNHK
ncbi:MAG: hypothetical protein ACOYXC_03885 [Candidatus Rifleibacteriota bacterium]